MLRLTRPASKTREVSASLKSIRQLMYEQFNTFFAIFFSAKRLPELLLDTEPKKKKKKNQGCISLSTEIRQKRKKVRKGEKGLFDIGSCIHPYGTFYQPKSQTSAPSIPLIIGLYKKTTRIRKTHQIPINYFDGLIEIRWQTKPDQKRVENLKLRKEPCAAWQKPYLCHDAC